MCGICGYFSDQEISARALQEMNDTMYHRGPDDSGIWQEVSGRGAVGLAQRRLSILDLPPMGHQPMFSRDNKIAAVYNGEIYNYRELKKELEAAGHTFVSACDTEVMIAAYQQWGYECFGRFNGMFAIALYETESATLILARDRMGKKPLYYYKKGKDFVFASELKPIMKYPGFRKKIDKRMIKKLLCSKYIEAPDSIFEDTFKMLPGSYLVRRDGETVLRRYWDIIEQKRLGMERPLSYEASLRELEGLVLDSVAKRLIADVPTGVFLSGGIDSALVTAAARQVSGEPVKSFSIGFHEKERNEAVFAAEIARYLGTKHKELYIGDKETLSLLHDLPYYYDEPFSDSSQLPTMLVSRLASEDIKVALSGDGGDELFCGYKMYDWVFIAQKAEWMRRIVAPVMGSMPLRQKLPAELRAFLNNRDSNYKTQFFLHVMMEEADKLLGMPEAEVRYGWEKELHYRNWQERRMVLDMMTYLPDEVLAKTDRASMKYSLEVRCPLLDYRIVELAFSIPHGFKYKKGNKKYILKELAYQYIPRELLDRPKKGFGVPLRKWLRTVLAPEIDRYADQDILKRQNIFVPEAVGELIRRQEKSDRIMYSSMLWSFYVFQRWYQMFVEDLWDR